MRLKILGVAKVVSYEDLQKATVERAAKDTKKVAKKAAKGAKRAARATSLAEDAHLSKEKRGRKRKGAALEHEAGDIERRTELLRTGNTQVKEVEIELWK